MSSGIVRHVAGKLNHGPGANAGKTGFAWRRGNGYAWVVELKNMTAAVQGNDLMQVRPFKRGPLSVHRPRDAMRGLGLCNRKMEILQMRKLCAVTIATILGLAGLALQAGHAAVNISFDKSALQTLQQEFISGTTAQYLSTLTKSPYFSDTYSLVIKGKNPEYEPPPDPIGTATAMDECFAHGFVFGMEDERDDDLNIISGLKDNLLVTRTCGGLISGTTVATDAFLDGCWSAYSVATSTITQRNGLYPTVILAPK
jgi:hypothetical protein